MLVRYDWVIFLIIASLQCCVDNVKDILKEGNNRGNPHTNLASSVWELYLYELQIKLIIKQIPHTKIANRS